MLLENDGGRDQHRDPARGNRVTQALFRCRCCGHGDNADANAARNVETLGRACEQAWAHAGRPLLKRPAAHMQRRTISTTTAGGTPAGAPPAGPGPGRPRAPRTPRSTVRGANEDQRRQPQAVNVNS